MIDNYKTNVPIVKIWGQYTCFRPVFQAKSDFRGFVIINHFLTGTETICQFSKSIFSFLLITFSFINIFIKFQLPSPINRPCSTTLDLCTFFVSRLLWGEIWGFSPKFLRISSKNSYYKKVDFQSKIKVVEQGIFILTELGIFEKFWKMEELCLMHLERFVKLSLHQWKINLWYSKLGNRILLEKLA